MNKGLYVSMIAHYHE